MGFRKDSTCGRLMSSLKESHTQSSLLMTMNRGTRPHRSTSKEHKISGNSTKILKSTRPQSKLCQRRALDFSCPRRNHPRLRSTWCCFVIAVRLTRRDLSSVCHRDSHCSTRNRVSTFVPRVAPVSLCQPPQVIHPRTLHVDMKLVERETRVQSWSWSWCCTIHTSLFVLLRLLKLLKLLLSQLLKVLKSNISKTNKSDRPTSHPLHPHPQQPPSSWAEETPNSFDDTLMYLCSSVGLVFEKMKILTLEHYVCRTKYHLLVLLGYVKTDLTARRTRAGQGNTSTFLVLLTFLESLTSVSSPLVHLLLFLLLFCHLRLTILIVSTPSFDLFVVYLWLPCPIGLVRCFTLFEMIRVDVLKRFRWVGREPSSLFGIIAIPRFLRFSVSETISKSSPAGQHHSRWGCQSSQ